MSVADFGWHVAEAKLDPDGAFGSCLPAMADPTRTMPVSALDFERPPELGGM